MSICPMVSINDFVLKKRFDKYTTYFIFIFVFRLMVWGREAVIPFTT